MKSECQSTVLRPLGRNAIPIKSRNTMLKEMAERVGFEPTVVFSYARFPGVCLKPLSHLSAESRRNVQSARRWRNEFLAHDAAQAHCGCALRLRNHSSALYSP